MAEPPFGLNIPDPPLIPPSGNYQSLYVAELKVGQFFGNLTGPLATNDITREDPTQPVNLFNDTNGLINFGQNASEINIGSLTLNSSDVLGNLGNPILPQDAATKAYVDSEASSGDPHIVVVKEDAMGSTFSSINSALASITLNSSSNPFIIIVNPGSYTETTISMKPYVYIQGYGLQESLISLEGPGPLIVACDNSSLKNCQLLTDLSNITAITYNGLNVGNFTGFTIDTVLFNGFSELVDKA